MNGFENFELQTHLFGLKPKEGKALQEIYKKAQELTGEADVDLNHEKLKQLWDDFELNKVELEWPDAEFNCEAGLRKRALLLGQTLVLKLDDKQELAKEDFLTDEWKHLIQHGKLGLMSLCFALTQRNEDLKVNQCATLIELFMDNIEAQFLALLNEERADDIARVLKIPPRTSEQAFDNFIHARLQPFALMRGLYLEPSQSDLNPLQWWTANERFIPDLPL